MAFTWEALYNFFTPPASRNPSPESSPSFLSSAFTSLRSGETPSSTKQHTDLPMPPTSAFFGRGGGANAPASPSSPADSSTSISAASESDFFPPPTMTTTTSPYTHRSPSLSSTSTNTTTSDLEQPHARPSAQQRTHTTPPTVSVTATSSSLSPKQLPQRPPAPRRSATNIVAPEPLSRDFPLPSSDADASLEELLARPPPRWSLGHYVKHARVRPAAVGDEDGAERGGRSVALEEAKRELLRAKREVDFVVASRGL